MMDSRSKRWIISFLVLVVMILIGINMSNDNDDDRHLDVASENPTYQSRDVTTVVYNPIGNLSYKLVAEEVKYFSDNKDSWFTAPVMTLYDESINANWTIRADKAKLTNAKTLYLYGNVEVNNLAAQAQLEKVKTENAFVDLTTQDITSDEQVTIYGDGFVSTGMKLRGNLRQKRAELLDKVQTHYEIQPNAK